MNLLKDVTEILQRIVEILAIAVGGLWAYWNYFRGRPYRPRLEFEIQGAVLTTAGAKLLSMKVRMKNIGTSKVVIQHEGTALSVYAAEMLTMAPNPQVDWYHIGTFPIFEAHDWLESTESVGDTLVLPLPPGNRAAFDVKLRLVSRGLVWTEGIIIPDEAVKLVE